MRSDCVVFGLLAELSRRNRSHPLRPMRLNSLHGCRRSPFSVDVCSWLTTCDISFTQVFALRCRATSEDADRQSKDLQMGRRGWRGLATPSVCDTTVPVCSWPL